MFLKADLIWGMPVRLILLFIGVVVLAINMAVKKDYSPINRGQMKIAIVALVALIIWTLYRGGYFSN
jgi:hypothetical protein